MWVLVKIMVPFWILLSYGTQYLGYPKRAHKFDNHPCTWTSEPITLRAFKDLKGSQSLHSEKRTSQCAMVIHGARCLLGPLEQRIKLPEGVRELRFHRLEASGGDHLLHPRESEILRSDSTHCTRHHIQTPNTSPHLSSPPQDPLSFIGGF